MPNQPTSIYTAKYPRGWEVRIRIPDSNMKSAVAGNINNRKFICMKVRAALKTANPRTAVPSFIKWEELQLIYIDAAR